MRIADGDEGLLDDCRRLCETGVDIAKGPFGSELAANRLFARLNGVDSGTRPLDIADLSAADRRAFGAFLLGSNEHIALRIGVRATGA